MNTKLVCKLPRRLASAFYDGLILFSLLFISSFLVLPFTGGKAVASDNLIYPACLFLATYLYFVWQWTHGGHTLGMRAWQCRLETEDSIIVSWKSASLRFLLSIFSWALFGLGFIWALFDKENLTFHDRFSNTLLIMKPHEQ